MENREALIPWGATVERLRDIGTPEIRMDSPQRRGPPPRFCFSWDDEKVFGGLSVSVGATLFEKQKLNELSFGTYSAEIDIDVASEHARIKAHLERSLGKHFRCWEDDYVSLPSFAWRVGKTEVTLSVGDRFGEYCTLTARRLK